jgi:hypothetical protein
MAAGDMVAREHFAEARLGMLEAAGHESAAACQMEEYQLAPVVALYHV